MVVEKGFKQTELGVIPLEWSVETLKDVCTYRRGSFPQPYGLSIWYDEINGAPFVQVFDIDSNWKIKPFTKRYISELAQRQSVYAPKGSIVLTIQGSIGRIAITQYDAFVDRTLLIFESFKIKFDKVYFCLAIESLFEKERQNAPGGIIKTITKEALSSFLIPIPPLPEQTAIATALSDMDALIAQTEKLSEKKKAIKQGVMQELLRPKEGWVTKKLGEKSLIFRGGSPRPIEDYLTTAPDGINWIKIGDVGKNAKYITSTEEKITPAGMSRSRVVKPGDFLLSNSMSFGRPYIMQIDGCIHDGWLVITEYESNFDRDFLYYVLGSEAVFAQYKSMASGSSVLNLNKEIVKSVNIICPENLDEQVRIANILSDIDIDLDFTKTKLQKLKLQKQGMMQALLTGKIRLV